MRRFLRHLAAWSAAPRPAASASEGRMPPFPIIDGGALACPDLAAALVTVALSFRTMPDA